MEAKLIKTLLVFAALGLVAGNAQADTIFTFNDTWKDWGDGQIALPNPYTTPLPDVHGTPSVTQMVVTVSDSGFLSNVDVKLDNPTRQLFDSLFINSYNTDTTNAEWDDWDQFVNTGGPGHASEVGGTIPEEGLYQVSADYDYTFATSARTRTGNPNGIDAGSLSLLDGSIIGNQSGLTISYAFGEAGMDVSEGFFIAYSPWCANDVMGTAPPAIPEPTTMLLFGVGLVGLASVGRKKMKRS